jgi:hypothetical protein
MANSNHKYKEEIDLLKKSLYNFGTIEDHSEQAIIITVKYLI